MFSLFLISAGENKPSDQICTTERGNIAVLHLIKHKAMKTHESEAFVDLYTIKPRKLQNENCNYLHPLVQGIPRDVSHFMYPLFKDLQLLRSAEVRVCDKNLP
jgi:hypothetical protein